VLHRKTCAGRASNRKPSSISSTPKSPERDEEAASEEDESASAVPSSTGKGARKNEADRQRHLEDDPRSEEVRPYEVLCKTCSKWIKLGNKRRFNLEPWKGHQKRCSGQIPSSRIATAERKLKLVNDGLAKKFTTSSVECARCRASVALVGEGDYDLSNWEAHKASCGPGAGPAPPPAATTTTATTSSVSPDARGGDNANSTTDPGIGGYAGDRPSLSVASTDATAVDRSPALVPGPSRGLKRARDDDDPHIAHEHPPRRLRTAAYTPSGALSWLLTPIRSFIAGFKDGINSSSALAASSSPTRSA